MSSEIIAFLFCVGAVLLQTGGSALKYQDEVNFQNAISHEERRAATPETGLKPKSGLRTSETKTFHRFYFPSAHESSGIGSSGSGAYGHNAGGYSHGGPQYYIPSGHTFHSAGQSFGELGGGHGGGTYDGAEYGGDYGLVHGEGVGVGHGVSTGHKEGSHKALALKAILIPLAGIALLGAAAALSTNPVLLQLGVLNGRRRRRSLREKSRAVYPTNPNVRPARASHL